MKSQVGEGGLEPPPLARHDPKSCADTNFATRPYLYSNSRNTDRKSHKLVESRGAMPYSVKNRSMSGVKYPPIAQLVEQIPLKDMVPGSSPGGRTKFSTPSESCVL